MTLQKAKEQEIQREADLMAAYEVCFACGDFDYILSTLIQKQRDWRRKKGIAAPEE